MARNTPIQFIKTRITLSLILGAIVVACAGNDQAGAPAASASGPTERAQGFLRVRVEPYREACQGIGPQLCFVVTREGRTYTELLRDPIEGFRYQWGHRYILDIKVDRRTAPPADAASQVWRLEKVVRDQPDEGVEALFARMDTALFTQSGPCLFQVGGEVAFQPRSPSLCRKSLSHIDNGGEFIAELGFEPGPDRPVWLNSIAPTDGAHDEY